MIAAHRQDRPWIGETVVAPSDPVPRYLPSCTLCPGNTRVSGEKNEAYAKTFVFDNDHPCVGLHAPATLKPPTGIYRNQPAAGIARVVCFSPRHDLTLAEMEICDIEEVLATWQREFRELAAHPTIRSVHMFENKGEVVGVSNPHPHGQIYATNFVFRTLEVELDACQRHYNDTGSVLFQDILSAEERDASRIVCERETCIAFIPYFARYAYELFLAPKRTHANIASLDDAEICDLAALLKDVLIRLDNLWKMSFPYIMAFHQAPTDGANHECFHFHIEMHPPLRKPNVMKYLAGAEVGAGNFLSDTIPERKASELRALPDVHYRAAAPSTLEADARCM